MLKNPRLATVLALLAFALVMAGCSKDDDPMSPTGSTSITPDTDTAEVVASDLGADDGGLTDQMADLATAVGGLNAAKDFVNDRFREANYDETTGTWTITVERERGNPDGVPYASISRLYTLRFLDAAGDPQQFRIVDGDTATTVDFDILSGSGVHRTRRVEQSLDSLEGSFVVTGVNTDWLTVNGTYARAATNHLETPRFSRTHAGQLGLELMDVVVPRGAGRDYSQAISGTVNGTYVADITIERGDDYLEQHIERTFSIVFGDGEGTLTMDGNLYHCRLSDGVLLD